MFSKFYNYFWGEVSRLNEREDLGHLKKERLFLKLTFVANIVLFIFVILNYLNHKIVAMWFDVAIALLLMVNARRFRVKRNLDSAVLVLTSSVIFLTSLLHYWAPHYLSANELWLPVMLMVSAFLSSKKHTLIVTIWGVVLFITAYILPMYITFIPDDIPRVNAEIVNVALVIFSSFTILILVKHVSDEEQRIRDVLTKGREYFKRSNESSAALTAIITHDLASPLMVVRESLKMAKRSDDIQVKDKAIDKALAAADRINNLISEVKSIRALESGKLQVNGAKVSLYDAVVEAIDYAKIQANKKNIYLNLVEEASEFKDIEVIAERNTLVSSVLGNILSNAIKFSFPDSKIDIYLVKEGEYLKLTIQDYGVGITKELREHLFDFTVPTSRKGTAGEVGTGFGMPLVKMFLDRFGADISIISHPEAGEKGTAFILSFKIA